MKFCVLPSSAGKFGLNKENLVGIYDLAGVKKKTPIDNGTTIMYNVNIHVYIPCLFSDEIHSLRQRGLLKRLADLTCSRPNTAGTAVTSATFSAAAKVRF